MKIHCDIMSRADEIASDIISFERSELGKGVCMCGDYVNGHNWGCGHSPVDSHDYNLMLMREELNKALGSS